jgi:hypothetical protein
MSSDKGKEKMKNNINKLSTHHRIQVEKVPKDPDRAGTLNRLAEIVVKQLSEAVKKNKDLTYIHVYIDELSSKKDILTFDINYFNFNAFIEEIKKFEWLTEDNHIDNYLRNKKQWKRLSESDKNKSVPFLITWTLDEAVITCGSYGVIVSEEDPKKDRKQEIKHLNEQLKSLNKAIKSRSLYVSPVGKTNSLHKVN